MSTFKIQRIRSCVQCKTVLGLKCKACIKHPDRVPRVITLHDWPKILQTCPSGHCIRIACHRPGCGNENVWRLLKTAKGGKSIYAESFCSRRCNILVRAAEKNQKVMVRCAWDDCTVKVPRKPSEIKKLKRAFCNPEHYFLRLRKDAHEEKERRIAAQAAAAKKDQDLASLWCAKCCDVTVHEAPAGRLATCKTCAVKRDAPSSAMGSGETNRMRLAGFVTTP